MDQLKLKLTQPKLSLSWGIDKLWQQINVKYNLLIEDPKSDFEGRTDRQVLL